MSQRSIVLSRAVVTDALVAERLAMEVSTEFLRLSRIRLADERPLAVDHVWLPASRVRPLANVDFSNTALYKELQDHCGITLDGGREELHAETATEDVAALLQCRVGAPLFRIERIGCHQGEKIEFRRTHILGDRYVASAAFGVAPPTA
ncbi:MAG: GntR family transcriptional regulator [Lacisediminihabitans sp.]